MKGHVKAPKSYKPSSRHAREYLAYLNKDEMELLMRAGGRERPARGPRNLPSFPPSDATSGPNNSGYGSGGTKTTNSNTGGGMGPGRGTSAGSATTGNYSSQSGPGTKAGPSPNSGNYGGSNNSGTKTTSSNPNVKTSNPSSTSGVSGNKSSSNPNVKTSNPTSGVTGNKSSTTSTAGKAPTSSTTTGPRGPTNAAGNPSVTSPSGPAGSVTRSPGLGAIAASPASIAAAQPQAPSYPGMFNAADPGPGWSNGAPRSGVEKVSRDPASVLGDPTDTRKHVPAALSPQIGADGAPYRSYAKFSPSGIPMPAQNPLSDDDKFPQYRDAQGNPVKGKYGRSELNNTDLGTISKVVSLQDRYGKPMKITEGQTQHGHVGKSYHKAIPGRNDQGLALDLAVPERDRAAVVKMASDLGFGGVGIYNNYPNMVHVDTRRAVQGWGPGGTIAGIDRKVADKNLANAIKAHDALKAPVRQAAFDPPKGAPTQVPRSGVQTASNGLTPGPEFSGFTPPSAPPPSGKQFTDRVPQENTAPAKVVQDKYQDRVPQEAPTQAFEPVPGGAPWYVKAPGYVADQVGAIKQNIAAAMPSRAVQGLLRSGWVPSSVIASQGGQALGDALRTGHYNAVAGLRDALTTSAPPAGPAPDPGQSRGGPVNISTDPAPSAPSSGPSGVVSGGHPDFTPSDWASYPGQPSQWARDPRSWQGNGRGEQSVTIAGRRVPVGKLAAALGSGSVGGGLSNQPLISYTPNAPTTSRELSAAEQEAVLRQLLGEEWFA